MYSLLDTQTVERITGTQERWRLRHRGLPSEWCRRRRFIAPGQSFAAKENPIPYDFALTPYAEEAVDDLIHPDVQTSVWMWASDLGKTETALNLMGYKIEEDPTKILVLYPIDRSARTWAKESLEPMIEHTPTLRGRVAEKRTRDSKNTISHKIFPGGSISVIAGGSKSNFRQRRAGVAVADEIDALKGDIGGEGDPISLLFKRTEGYEDSVQLLMSTPTVKGRSRIEWWFDQSDKRFWFVPCRKCGAWFQLEWKLVEWPKGKPENAVIVCPECPATHDDEQRKRMIREGEWRPTAPFRGVRGRNLNGIYSLFPAKKGYRSKLHQFAQDCIDAAHSNNRKETVKVWVNTFLNQTYRAEADLTPDWKPLYDRRESYTLDKIPQRIVLITFGTDFQDDRVELEFVGWGPNNYESWGLGRYVFNSSPKFPRVYGELEALLLQTFTREDGAKLRAKVGGFDTGFPSCVKILYQWLRPRLRYGWYAMKGSSLIDAEPVSRSKSSRVDRVTLFMVGTNRIKDFIYSRAALSTPAEGEEPLPGFMHFPECYDEEFFRQLFSEESTTVMKNGVAYKQFALPQGATPEGGTKRNEVLDCRVYAEAALYARGVTNWDYEEKLNLATIPGAEKAEAKPQRQRRRSSFVRDALGHDWDTQMSRGWRL